MRRLLFVFIAVNLFFGCFDTKTEDQFSLTEKGDLLFARREYLAAADSWKKAYLKDRKNILLINKLGECYLKLGRLERAKLFFQEAAGITPDDIDIQIKLAQVYVLTGNLPQADRICEAFDKKNISHPELDLIRADINLMANQMEQAEHFYRRAIIGSKDSLRTLMKLAIFLKSASRHEEAMEILDIVKKNAIAVSQIYLLMADFYLLDYQYDQAEQSIISAIGLEPEDNSLKYHLVQFYMATDNTVKAETILKNILKNQNDIYLRMMLADIYLLNSKLKKAEEIILSLKDEINEPTVEFELLQGKFWLYSGRTVYATSHFKSALELKPGLVNTRYLLGLTHLINGKLKLSENSLTRALQISPNHYKALLLISEILYKKKDYSLSLSYLDRIIEDAPEDFTARILKGLNLLGQNKYLPAKEEFNTSLHLSRRTYIAYYYLGLTEELMNNDSKALAYYKQVLDVYPDLMDVSYRYCMLLLKNKQNKLADDFVKKKLADVGASPELYFLAAKVALKMGHLPQGETFFQKAIQLDSAPGFIYMEFAMFYKNNRQTKKAMDILKQCTIKKPYFPDAWISLSKLLADSQDMKTALEIMEQGYKKFQDSAIFQSNLAWLLLEDDPQTNEALSLAQSAYEKSPDDIGIADTLGWAYFHKGIYSQAVWLLSGAQKKAPENGFIRYHLGMTYYRQGEIDKAVEQFKIARASADSGSFSNEIDNVFAKLAKEKTSASKIEISAEKELLLSPPENGMSDESLIPPQWKP